MSKKNRYKRIKDKFIASAGGGLVAGMIFIGTANSALADTIRAPGYQKSSVTGMHVMRRWNSRPKINALASNLGIDQTIMEEELKSGKNLKQILTENGLNADSLDRAFNSKSRHKSWKNHQLN
ncbi:MAG: hypothetical protein WAW92_02235 [Minisyncoccia bacterium]